MLVGPFFQKNGFTFTYSLFTGGKLRHVGVGGRVEKENVVKSKRNERSFECTPFDDNRIRNLG